MPQTTSNKHDSMIRINKRELKDQLDLSKEEFSYALKKQLKKKPNAFIRTKMNQEFKTNTHSNSHIHAFKQSGCQSTNLNLRCQQHLPST